jgi:D-glycero-alpha-D-manno-heptose-7-phosphate kinase
LEQFGELMNRHREYKQERSKSMSNDRIDHWYQLAIANDVLGGKLIDAGGDGFLMFLCQERARGLQVLTDEGLEEVRFRFDFEGTKVILQ